MQDAVNPVHDLGRAAGRDASHPVSERLPGTVCRSTDLLSWVPVGRDGTEVKVLRVEPERGASVALLRFSRGASTGLHTHLAPASSYFLSGSLLDFQGLAVAGELGVNPAGTIHDAYAPEDAILVSRLEGPVHAVELVDALRGADRDDPLAPVRTDVLGPPDINIRAADVDWEPTAFEGVHRRTLWQEGPNQSVSMLRLDAGAEVPAHLHIRPLDAYVLSGDLRADRGDYTAGDYTYSGPGTTRALRSSGGCEILCWSDGPAVFGADCAERLYLPPAKVGAGQLG